MPPYSTFVFFKTCLNWQRFKPRFLIKFTLETATSKTKFHLRILLQWTYLQIIQCITELITKQTAPLSRTQLHLASSIVKTFKASHFRPNKLCLSLSWINLLKRWVGSVTYCLQPKLASSKDIIAFLLILLINVSVKSSIPLATVRAERLMSGSSLIFSGHSSSAELLECMN
jgi:hypothetical protein